MNKNYIFNNKAIREYQEKYRFYTINVPLNLIFGYVIESSQRGDSDRYRKHIIFCEAIQKDTKTYDFIMELMKLCFLSIMAPYVEF